MLAINKHTILKNIGFVHTLHVQIKQVIHSKKHNWNFGSLSKLMTTRFVKVLTICRYFTKNKTFTSIHLLSVIIYSRQHGSDFDVTSLLRSLSQLTWTSTLDTGSLLRRFDSRQDIACNVNHHQTLCLSQQLPLYAASAWLSHPC